MAVLYTTEEIQQALRELRISPVDGGVTAQEAARILTWRAKVEQGIDHEYTAAAVRRRVHTGNLTPHRVNKRFNRFPVEAVFSLRLVPKQGVHEAA